jgi:hypothetical protein
VRIARRKEAMGVEKISKTSRFLDFEARREEVVHQYFEPQLARLGLSVEQIERQDLDELNQSLIKVNEAISHPDNFGTVKLKVTADAGM